MKILELDERIGRWIWDFAKVVWVFFMADEGLRFGLDYFYGIDLLLIAEESDNELLIKAVVGLVSSIGFFGSCFS